MVKKEHPILIMQEVLSIGDAEEAVEPEQML
jgi:hypothetical protein